MPFKTTALAFMASLAAHAILATSFYLPLWEGKDSADQLVEISYVHYTPKPSAPKPPQIKYSPMAKPARQVKGMSAPAREIPRAPEVRVSVPMGRSTAANSTKVSAFAVKNSEEILTDPQKGKIFLNYFGLVKQRVRRSVEKKYSGEPVGRGDVSLMFVLKSDGAVVNVFVVEKDSSADELMKDFAIRCVKDCSPFPHFPKELGMERISFNLSILFDES